MKEKILTFLNQNPGYHTYQEIEKGLNIKWWQFWALSRIYVIIYQLMEEKRILVRNRYTGEGNFPFTVVEFSLIKEENK